MALSFVIFGASGDLTSRKLVPALYQLSRKGRLPEAFRVIGFSRTKFSHTSWREALKASTEKMVGESFDLKAWQDFAKAIYYVPGDLQNREDFEQLKRFLDQQENDSESGSAPAIGSVAGSASGAPSTNQSSCSRVYYLATAPRFYEIAIEHLGASGLACETCGERRIVVEKPFGTDAQSARQLNTTLHQSFDEDQVYRIDHYLGKETVQNLLVLRFANSIFEPIWNRNYIDHVQITVAEEVDVAGRGGYFDSAGVIRDMFQNHLLQLLMFTAMDAPVKMTANLVRDEKVKVLQAIRPLVGSAIATNTLRGQYRGYQNEKGVASKSSTATFAAIKLWIDSWRWQGVPFYLRSGKAMSCRTTQIVIQFRQPPHQLFDNGTQTTLDGNRLVIQVQPAEGIQLQFQTKVPDAGMKMRMADLDFSFQQEFRGKIPEAYERLLLDAMQGDASLFARSDEVELAWSICDPILEAWKKTELPKLAIYEPSFWGPEESTQWMHDQGRQWFDTCPVLA